MALSLSKVSTWLRGDVLKKEAKNVIGVDIGASSIKIVQLHDKKGVPTLDTYGELQLGPYGGLEIGQITKTDTKKETQALIDIVRESSATAKDVALAISYNASLATVLSLQAKSEEDIGAMVPVEAKKYIPVPLNSVTLDWYPLPAGSEEKGVTNVFLVAIHNEALQEYRKVVAASGLAVRLTELELFSIVRSSVAQEDNTVALIDLGAAGTRLYIAKQGVITKTHSLRVSGAEMSEFVADMLKVSFAEAEELKRQGLPEHVEIRKKLEATLLRAFREIHQVMKQEESRSKSAIEKVVLVGGGSLFPGITSFAQDVFGIPVSLADPFSKVAYPAFLEDTLREAGPSFAAAIGVALQQLLKEK